MDPFRLNPDVVTRVQPIAPGLDCVVMDDFLADPAAAVDWAAANREAFEEQAQGYPGEVLEVPGDLLEDLHACVRNRMSRLFGFLRGDLQCSTLMSLATRQPAETNVLQRMPHTDPGAAPGRNNFAGLLYLFEDSALGGTGFYEWTDADVVASATRWHERSPARAERLLALRFPEFAGPPRYVTDSTSFARRLAEVEARYNRMVFYSGDIPHSAQIAHPEYLTPDVRTGRLTLNLFASVVLAP